MRISHPFKLASRSCRPEGSVLDLGKGVTIGGPEVVVAAGPCAVESAGADRRTSPRAWRARARNCCAAARSSRARSPYSFQGLGEEGLKLLRDAADKNGLLVVSEVMDPSQIEVMLPYVDVLQVGARNMQNYHLLRALGEIRQAGAAEARDVRDDRGIAAERGIHHGRRELQSDSCASAASARLRRTCAIPWISRRFR